MEECKVMHIGVNNGKEEYFMEGKKLEEIMEEKYLGVIVSLVVQLCDRAVTSSQNTWPSMYTLSR